MVYTNPFDSGRSRLLIEDSVLRDITNFRQAEPRASEAGGILLGYRREAHLHVVTATVPGPSDTRNRFRFHRHQEPHAQIALSEWAKSGKTKDYIGEWHTHPESDPHPSKLDLQEWQKICGTRQDPMVFVIRGIRRMWVGVGLGRIIKPSTLC